MSKTWEILFQLTSFMKYLLHEVLPTEKTDSPEYVLDSLFDLLNYTLQCIQIVKEKDTCNFNSLKRNLHEHLLKSASEIKVHADPLPTDDLKVNETPMCAGSNDKNIEQIPKKKKTKKKSIDAKEVGTPNDKCDSREDNPPPNLIDTNKSSNKKSELIETLKRVGSQGGTSLTRHQNIIISKNFLFLNEQFSSGNESFGCYCLPCDCCFFSIPDWKVHSADSQHISKLRTSECVEIDCENCNFHVFGRYPLACIYLDYHAKLHLERENYELPVTENNIPPPSLDDINNMEKKKVKQVKKYLSNENSISFETLSLSSRSSQAEFVPDDMSSKSENDDGLINVTSKKKANTIKSSGSKLDQDYFICKKFRELNDIIYEEKLNGAFYCRPCDEYFLLKELWRDHSLAEKHIVYMNDPHFKNFEAICSYCNLLFVGTKRPIDEYMKYHSTLHKKTPNYSVISLLPQVSSNEPRNKKNKKSEKFVSPHSRECFEDIPKNETYSDTSNNNSSNTPGSVQNVPKPPTTHNSKDWYSSFNDDEIISKIQRLFIDRKREKVTGKTPSFMGYCILCELIIEDAFNWIDHLDQGSHCSLVKQEDEEAIFSDFNFNIFGNRSILKDFIPP